MQWIAEFVNVPVHENGLGSLAVIERSEFTPFDPVRAYFIYDVPAETSRGFHAHKNLQQLMIAVSGSLCVTIDDGKQRKDFLLDSPSKGLLLRPGAWREMHTFSSKSICLVVASEKFDEKDYIRNYSDFLTWKKSEC